MPSIAEAILRVADLLDHELRFALANHVSFHKKTRLGEPGGLWRKFVGGARLISSVRDYALRLDRARKNTSLIVNPTAIPITANATWIAV